MSSGVLDLFLIERPGVQLGYVDGFYSYGREQGEEWVQEVLTRWPHPGGAQHPPYRRDSIRAVVADIAALQPLVSITISPEASASPPEGMVRVRRRETGDFESDDDLGLDGPQKQEKDESNAVG